MKNTEHSPRPGLERRTAVLLAATAAIISIIVRLIPFGMRPPNFASNGALGLFAGARIPLWLAVPLQVCALVVSDVLLMKLFGWPGFNPAVYLSFLGYLLLGRSLLKSVRSPGRVALVSLAGSVQFFLITNFYVWLGDGSTAAPLYPPTLDGLLACYGAGLLYLLFTVWGDLGFSAAVFGAELWIEGLIGAEKPVMQTEEAVP